MKRIAIVMFCLTAGALVYLVGFHRPQYESASPLTIEEALKHTGFHFPDDAHTIMYFSKYLGPGHFQSYLSFKTRNALSSSWIDSCTNRGPDRWTQRPVDTIEDIALGRGPPWWDITNSINGVLIENDRTPMRRMWINSTSNHVWCEEAD